MTVTEWARARLLAHGWTPDKDGGMWRRGSGPWTEMAVALLTVDDELRAAAREDGVNRHDANNVGWSWMLGCQDCMEANPWADPMVESKHWLHNAMVRAAAREEEER